MKKLLILLALVLVQPDSRQEHGTSAIQVDVPAVRQPNSYSCFAASLFAVEAYWGVGEKDLPTLERKLGTNRKNGTDYRRVVEHAQAQGLQAYFMAGMSASELDDYLSKHRPVIVSLQAYGNPAEYWRNVNGHDVVVVGTDGKNYYFMDPSTDGRRTYLPVAEFLERWHDDEGTASKPDVIKRLGIVIWRDEPRKLMAVKLP